MPTGTAAGLTAPELAPPPPAPIPSVETSTEVGRQTPTGRQADAAATPPLDRDEPEPGPEAEAATEDEPPPSGESPPSTTTPVTPANDRPTPTHELDEDHEEASAPEADREDGGDEPDTDTDAHIGTTAKPDDGGDEPEPEPAWVAAAAAAAASLSSTGPTNTDTTSTPVPSIDEMPPPHPRDWSPAPLAPTRSPLERLRRAGQRRGDQPGGGNRRSRLPLAAGGALVVVAIVAVAVVVLSGGGDPELSYRGERLDQPLETLSAAEASLRDIVEARNGAIHDESRCYFSVSGSGSGEVNDYLRCGPVLFVDDDPVRPYLTFPLQVEGDPAAGTAVRLIAANQPDSPDPTALDDGERLRRPDGRSAPDGAGGLVAPAPPRAEPGLVVADPLDDIELAEPDDPAQVVSWSQSYRLTGTAEPERFGHDDDARRPAEGERFVAARVGLAEGEAPANPAAPPQVAIQVDDEAPVPVPAEVVALVDPSGLIVSVPDDARRVDLVVTELGVAQRLSLLTGEPGDSSVAVLQRQNRTQQVDAAADLTFTASAPGRVSESFTVSVSAPRVRLYWFFGADGRQHPDDPNRAYLVPETSFAWDPRLGLGADVSLDPAAFALELPDGSVVPATNLAPGDGILVVFDVPADFTTGTLIVGGRYTDNEGVTIDFGTSALRVPIEIPAG